MDDRVHQARSMRADNYSLGRIAKATGMSRSWVYYHTRDIPVSSHAGKRTDCRTRTVPPIEQVIEDLKTNRLSTLARRYGCGKSSILEAVRRYQEARPLERRMG